MLPGSVQLTGWHRTLETEPILPLEMGASGDGDRSRAITANGSSPDIRFAPYQNVS